MSLSSTTALALALAFSLTPAPAAKPTKPDGGGGAAPPGTIYFWQSTDTPYSYSEMKMNTDGSGKAPVGLSEQGQQFEPSHELHGGDRWFLKAEVTGVTDPDGTPRQELFAFTEGGARLQLTNDPNVEVDFARWAKDDSFLSFTGLFYGADGGRHLGLFVAAVDWSSGAPAVEVPQMILEGSYPYDLQLHDWSPAGDELVYMDSSQSDQQEIKVIRFFADGTTQTRHVEYGSNPAWSPAGGRIAFTGYDGSVWTIQPDGTDALQLTRGTFDRNQWDPTWSADGNYVAYTETVRKQKGFQAPTYTYDVFRVSATGANITNLTGDTDRNCFVCAWR